MITNKKLISNKNINQIYSFLNKTKFSAHNSYVKRKLFLNIILSLIIPTFIVAFSTPPKQGSLVFCAEKSSVNKQLKMAIVIDDFGYDRVGVEEMLNINCPLTCAVMPCLPYSMEDSQKAKEKGHEVILHMPMEAYGNLPESWYGSTYIKTTDSKAEVEQKLQASLESIGGAKLMNIHMGTAVSQNRAVMTDILSFCKDKSITFLDSRTIENTVCKEVGDSLNTKVLERDIFLEVNSRPSIHFAKQRIAEAIELCKKQGSVIVIGHIGPVGSNQTAQAIKESLETIKSAGIQIVPLSQI